jgi:hypothetical protein
MPIKSDAVLTTLTLHDLCEETHETAGVGQSSGSARSYRQQPLCSKEVNKMSEIEKKNPVVMIALQ